MSIKVNAITKIYGTQKALDAVSFEIAPGEVVGLLGPNGAGKSTIMKILTCFIPPTSGSASVCHFDVQEQSIDVRKKVGYLPENNPLYLDLYVKEFLNFIAGIQHQSSVVNRQQAIGKREPENSGKGLSSSKRNFKSLYLPSGDGQWSAEKRHRRIDEIIDLTG